MPEHKVGTREEWLAARQQLLAREKELTHRADELTRQRQELPWVRIDKEYRFESENGPKTLAQLFDGRSQLLVYHFMFGEEYTAGCPMCSAIADSVNGVVPHLHARDVTFLCISRAPLERLQAYKRRMGWTFPWVSSRKTDFNFDFDVSHTKEQLATFLQGGLPPIVTQFAVACGTDAAGYIAEGPGLSAFVLADGAVYHAYSTYERGLEIMLGFYPLLDRVPQGRNERDDQPFWVRRHDEYPRESEHSRRSEQRVDFADTRSTLP
jgi:predicted dithiol-disulfide oxidoreductase (DUF899 family)